ncbi:MAG: hypothetical protein AB8H79_09790 [Myxococcota bacterium]
MADQAQSRGFARVVDVGPGAQPHTTIELHRAVRARVPTAQTTGIDVDPSRVAGLLEAAEPGVRGVEGGFDHRFDPLVDLVRAANVLRQYRLDQVGPSLRAMGRWLRPGGWLIEGTTDKEGHRGCFRVFQCGEFDLEPWGMVFINDGALGFDPRALTPYLPRGMGWHGHPGPLVKPLFEAWSEAAAVARQAGIREPAAVFESSATALCRHPPPHPGVMVVRREDAPERFGPEAWV